MTLQLSPSSLRVVTMALAVAVLTICATGPAHAAAPRPALSTTPGIGNCVVPPLLPVVGHDGAGSADPLGDFLVIVRDLANQPVPNAVVTINFGNCTELRICADQHDPGAFVDCTGNAISKVADVNGEARFRVIGCSVAPGGGPGAGWNCTRVYADGMFIASPTAAIYDLAGCDGVNAGDLASALTDFFENPNVGRIDYDGSGDHTANDLAVWLGVFFGSNSIVTCSGARCGP